MLAYWPIGVARANPSRPSRAGSKLSSPGKFRSAGRSKKQLGPVFVGRPLLIIIYELSNVKFKFFLRKPILKQKAVIFKISRQANEMATIVVDVKIFLLCSWRFKALKVRFAGCATFSSNVIPRQTGLRLYGTGSSFSRRSNSKPTLLPAE